MELQIPRRVCPEISSESILRAKAVRYRQNLVRVVQMEANKHHRSGSLPRPRAYAVGNTAENDRVIVYGISERQKQPDDIRTVEQHQIQVSQRGVPEQRLLRGHSGEKCAYIHKESDERRRSVRSADSGFVRSVYG